MALVIKQLNDTDGEIAPVTVTDAVYNASGQSLETIISQLKDMDFGDEDES